MYQLGRALRDWSARPGPLLTVVEGRAGLDATPDLVRETQRITRRVVYVSPGLTDQENAASFAEAAAPWIPKDAGSGWPELLTSLAAQAPITVIIGRARTLSAVNKRIWQLLGDAWRGVRKSASRVHVVLVDEGFGLGTHLNRPESPFRDPSERLRSEPSPDPVEVLRLGSGSHYDLQKAFPDLGGMTLLKTWSRVGGLPVRWRQLQGGSPSQARLSRQALFDPDLNPGRTLEQHVQSPHRYASILGRIAGGARTRRDLVRQGLDPRGGSGPYLARLMELGMIAMDRPLGAPRSGRLVRYRITDPHETLWWAHVRPNASRLAVDPAGEGLWNNHIQPLMTRHLTQTMGDVLDAYLRRGAAPDLGATAREVGPLWGTGFDFVRAGTLTTGAVCYAHVHPGPGPADLASLETLHGQVRETRYGYGRQARIRILVSLFGFAESLRREAAKDPLVRLLGPAELTRPV